MPSLDSMQWGLLTIAAFGIGFSKSGFTGLAMVHVLIFASVFGARESTGVVLPLLIAGDVIATFTFGKHAVWTQVVKMLFPAMVGVVIGWRTMQWLDEALYRPLIGGIILVLACIQISRNRREDWFSGVPQSASFVWVMGILVGLTTMLANAAGPVFALFMIAIGLPKLEFVGTAALFFLLLNLAKLPFSWSLGLIRLDTLMLNLVLLPIVLVGIGVGRMVVSKIPQRTFDNVILVLIAGAAVQMLVTFIFS